MAKTVTATMRFVPAHFNRVAYANIPAYWSCEVDDVEQVVGPMKEYEHKECKGEGFSFGEAMDGLKAALKYWHYVGKCIVSYRNKAGVEKLYTIFVEGAPAVKKETKVSSEPEGLREYCRKESGGLTGKALDTYISKYYGLD